MNPRYTNFAQNMFVAGDVEQFEQYRDASNGSQPSVEIHPENNVWLKRVFEMKQEETFSRDVVENTDLPMYRNLSADSVDNTFFYIFDKFKKGVFVKIKDNRLAVFLPFSKHNFINEWSHRIRYDNTRFDSMSQFLLYASCQDGIKRPVKFNYNVEEWYANNSMFRNEYPLTERDRNLDELHDMLEDVCKERLIPDIEFFINRRDFPLLSKKGFEPYDHIYDADNVPLKSHSYNKYAPILSMVTTDRHSDIPIPTHEDWARVSSAAGGKIYSRDFRYPFELTWENKKHIAVFRGASTGSGVTHEVEVNPNTFNPRLFAAKLSRQRPDILDAGITEWNTRPRKIRQEPFLRTIEVEHLQIPLVERLSPVEQSQFKYILNIDGHVSAFRLSLELGMGSVVLLQEHTVGQTNYRMWFARSLQPFVHYVPVRRDLSDLIEKIEWCIAHDEECKQIAQNALTFYETYLTKSGVLDYWQYLLTRLKTTTGHYMYNEVDVDGEMLSSQKLFLSQHSQLSLVSQPSLFKDWSKIRFPFHFRDVTAKEALRQIVMSDVSIKLPLSTTYQSESTRIEKGTVGNIFLSVKTLKCVKQERVHQLINEAFCGIAAINKLCAEVPNFRYTFGILDNRLISEYIDGVTWDKFVEKCSIEELLFGLMQICLALMVAQERFGFVHNDLNGWNIVVKILPQPISIAYAFRDRVIRLTTNQVPVLIDYGRAHIIQNNRHYGQVHPFKFSPIQDCFCLIISTMAIFVNTLNHQNEFLNVALDITNFFTSSHFHPAVLRDRTRLIKFLKQYKKYNEMLYASKHAIEKLNALNLFDHLFNISKKLNLPSPFRIVMYPEKCEWVNYPSAPLQVYSLWMTGQHDKIRPFLKSFANQLSQLLEKSPHLICGLFSLNQFAHCLNGVENFDEQFFGKKLSSEIQSLSQKLSLAVENLDQLPDTSLVENLPSRQAMVIPRYTPRMFAIPSRLLTILQSYLQRPTTFYAELHDVMVYNFLFDQPISLDEDMERLIMKKNRKLFTWDPAIARVNCANVETIFWISRAVYPQQMEKIKPYVSVRMLEAYEQVLDFSYA